MRLPGGQAQSIFATLLEAERAGERVYGRELLERAGVQENAGYQVLRRMKAKGWVETELKENPRPGLPARGYLRLTDEGRQVAEALAAARAVFEGSK